MQGGDFYDCFKLKGNHCANSGNESIVHQSKQRDIDSLSYFQSANGLHKMSVSSFVGYLKGKSSLMIHERHRNYRYKYGNRTFWCRGYYVDTAVKNAKKIEEYIRNQLREDQIHDQMTLKEYTDPFTDGK